MRVACANGVFNPTLHTCVCRYGWGGDACDVYELSACSRHDERRRRSPSSPWRVCADQRVLSCACVQQCVRHGAFVGHMRRECEKRSSQDEAFGWIASSPVWAPNRTVRLRPPSRASARLRPDETRWDALETCVASRPGRCCKHDNRCAQPPLFACFSNCSGRGASSTARARASRRGTGPAARTAPARRRRRRRAMGCGSTCTMCRRSCWRGAATRATGIASGSSRRCRRACARTARRRRDAHADPRAADLFVVPAGTTKLGRDARVPPAPARVRAPRAALLQ